MRASVVPEQSTRLVYLPHPTLFLSRSLYPPSCPAIAHSFHPRPFPPALRDRTLPSRLWPGRSQAWWSSREKHS